MKHFISAQEYKLIWLLFSYLYKRELVDEFSDYLKDHADYLNEDHESIKSTIWSTKAAINSQMINTPEKRRAFDYLNQIQESGRINMMEAAPRIKRRFYYTTDICEELLFEWMETKE